MVENQLKSRKKMWLIIAILITLLAVIGGVLFFDKDKNKEETKKDMGNNQKINIASYINIPEPFIFNIDGNKRDRLAQIKVQLMVRDERSNALVRKHSPLVEDSILSTFSSVTVEKLRTPKGRINLREQATNDLKMAFTQTLGEPVIEKVLFTDFVIQ